MLLEEFKRQGIEQIQIITHTQDKCAEEFWPVHRRPSLREVARLAGWADLIYQHNPTLTYLWPSLAGKPTVISLHAWIERSNGKMGWKDRVKKKVLERFPCISNSRATADKMPFPTQIIPNPYDDRVFQNVTPWADRKGAVTVGRLVSSKGVEIAIQAIAILREQGCDMGMEVIGDGPQGDFLKRQARELGVSDLVFFAGQLAPQAVAERLNSARYLLAPSAFESFGIVALEGIACGCIPITTGGGGLVEAVGPCGPFFAKGNAAELASHLRRMEQSPEIADSFRSHAQDFLKPRTPRLVAAEYLRVFQSRLGYSQ